jgi:WXG100 family type VII secretion target
MPILHMEVETVQETSRAMLRAATELHDLMRSLQYAVASLDSAWQSDSASDFTTDVKRITRAIEQQINGLDELSQRVN